MGLSIFLDLKPYTTPEEVIQSRLNIAGNLLAFYRTYFSVKSVEIWRNAPAESLGGSCIKTVPLTERGWKEDYGLFLKDFNAYSLQTKVDLIVKFLGTWAIGKEIVTGFVNISNRGIWRSAYGDIEANIYSDEKHPDLVNLMKSESELERQLIDYFLIQFAKSADKEPLKITAMYFGVGTPSRDEVDGLTGVYYGSEDALIGDCFRTISAEQGEAVTNTYYPYKQKFLIGSLNDIPAFRQFLEEQFVRCHIIKTKAGSIALVGRDLESFKLLYSELSSKILEPLAKQLPNKIDLTKIIKEAVESKGKTTQTKLPK